MASAITNPTDTSHTETTTNYRPIKSYVLRTGRMTASQERALQEYFTLYGIAFDEQVTKLDFNDYFDKNQPLVLEIGLGMGDSLVEMAQANPELNYVGIEVHTPGIGNCLKLIHAKQLSNLKVICFDAIQVLQALPDHTLYGLQLFFPDPWHKARHKKRRIVKQSFLDLVAQKMKTGGFIHMATDWQDYSEHMLEDLTASPYFINTASAGNFIPRPDFRPLTKFEKRGHTKGHGVWDLYFKRI